ncbi:MAG: c-type cytochrome domain-containing protein, partial [Verrucomicrobiia bacterium]
MSFVKTAVILLICFTSGAANAAESVGFEERILPLFYQRCFSCHSEKEEKPKGGLKLDSVTSIRESGVIVPGQPEKSELLIRISLAHDDDDFMPPPKGGAQPFDAEEFAMMEAWIREGASFGDWVGFEHRQAPLEVTGKSLTMNDVPQLAAKMDELVEQTGGERNPPISNETFLRRIYLDVIGRIPTLAESRVFLDDSNPDKRAKLIQQ